MNRFLERCQQAWQRGIRAEYFTLLLAGVLVLFYNAPFWAALIEAQQQLNLSTAAFLVSCAIFFTALFYFILGLFALPWLQKALTVVVLVMASQALYFVTAYRVMIDSSMIQNMFETNWHESLELLSPALLSYLLLLGILPAVLVVRLKILYRPLRWQIVCNLVGVLLSALIVAVNMLVFNASYAATFREHRELRYLLNPLHVIHGVQVHFREAHKLLLPKVQPVGEDAVRIARLQLPHRKNVVVLVVGETARAQSFGLSGYGRDTTPWLQQGQDQVLYFSDMHACGTATAVSLPCMFSMLTRAGYDHEKAMTRENVLDVIARSGIFVLWLDNNSNCKRVCARVTYENLLGKSVAGLCTGGECYDEILLEGLAGRMDASAQDMLIVLHPMGSHGPAYFKRVPAEHRKFTPVCQKAALQECSHEEVVNAYDNTIVYTDFVLHRLIGLLREKSAQYNTAMVYVSDHGESLGEKGLYLHGMPYILAPQEQTHIPMVVWLSDAYVTAHQLSRKCLAGQADRFYSHDNISHSLLGLLGVQTKIYAEGLDVFAACMQGR